MYSPYTSYISLPSFPLPSSSYTSLYLLLLTFPLLRIHHPSFILPHSQIILNPLLSPLTSFHCTNHLSNKFSLYFLISRFLACILFSRWVERIYAVWIFSWNVCMIFGRSMSIRRRKLEEF